jgi:surfeit locus 1 family protein
MTGLAPDIRHARGKGRVRSRVLLTVFALGAFAILIALGIWQLQRREWKNDLVARFEAALSKPPVAYEPPPPNANEAAREFTRVSASGEFLDAQTVKMLVPAPDPMRAESGDGFGYLVFTPLKIGGAAVFVNRGFAPRQAVDAGAIRGGAASVTGILRVSQEPGLFTPPPDLAKRLFFSADIPAMAQAASVAGAVLGEYIEAEPAHGADGWPKPRDPRDLLASIPNRHLEYALTWFGLAAALAVVYGFVIARS